MVDELIGGDSSATPSLGGNEPSSSTPTPIDLTDDSLVRINGAKDPVKYGDYYRGMQSQLTKKSQEAANYARQHQEYQTALSQREQLIQRYEAHLRSLQGGGNSSPKQSVLDQIKTLPYISGEDANKLAEHLSGQFGGFGQELSKRDQVLQILAKELLSMKQQFSSVQTERTNSAFDSKITGWVRSMGLPPEANDFAKELYLAYEGDDLDQEFPGILKTRWESLQKMFKATEAAKIAQSRNLPFTPGRGGNGTPTKPFELKANASSKEIADMLFPMLGGGE